MQGDDVPANVEARRRSRYRYGFDKLDIFYRFDELPLWVREELLLQHKNNRQRFRLFLFLVGNGMPPAFAEMLILSKDFVDKVWIGGEYDNSARTQMANLKQRCDALAPDNLFRSYPYFDMIVGKVLNPADK